MKERLALVFEFEFTDKAQPMIMNEVLMGIKTSVVKQYEVNKVGNKMLNSEIRMIDDETYEQFDNRKKKSKIILA